MEYKAHTILSIHRDILDSANIFSTLSNDKVLYSRWIKEILPMKEGISIS